MIINLVLCDNDGETFKLLSEFIKTFTMMQHGDTDYRLTYFPSSAELLTSNADFDVLFLETELERDKNGKIVDGISVGKALRRRGNRAAFILLTNRTDRYAEGYAATVFRYVLKPLCQQQFDALMAELFAFWQSNNKMLLIHYEKQTDYIRVNDIIMIENYKKKRMIHTQSQVFYVKESWESLESRLYNDGRFFKPQRGFLINFMYVSNNNKTSITMKCGTIIPFKRGSYDEFCRKSKDYLEYFC